MGKPARPDADANTGQASKVHELRAFLFLTLMLAPIISVVLIGSYGFLVWIFQILS